MSNCLNIKQLVNIFKRNLEDSIRSKKFDKIIPRNSFKTNYYILNTLSNLNLEKNDCTENIKGYLYDNISSQISPSLGGTNLFNLFNCKF